MTTPRYRVLALVVALAWPGVAPAQEGGTRRVVLVAGANDGGKARTRLRYANTDADAIAAVLQELGGVGSRELVVLRDANATTLRAALVDLQRRVRAAKAAGAARVESFFYYSGHSDEEGLLLGEERLPYGELRASLDALDATVRIAVVDSCASGALTRGKGGFRRPAFMVDESTDVVGHAFLTSASENEVAQESDRIGGSFFTHYFISGLRGAADATQDGQVTLAEVYQFAYSETLARTERTRSGPQHPAYDIQLAGTGDLVMTDIRQAGARLVLSGDLTGRLFVRDASGALAAELRKPGGRTLELALPAGRYTVTVERDEGRLGAVVALAAGRRTRLHSSDLREVVIEQTVARGDVADGDVVAPADDLYGVAYGQPVPRTIGFNAALLPGLSINGDEHYVLNHFAFNLLAGDGDHLHGFEMGIGANIRSTYANGGQLAVGANLVWGTLRGLQLAGFFNYAKMGRGLQVSPVNITGERFSGLQLGLVNIAGAYTGAQIGLVNISEDADAPVGLVNIVREGLHEVSVLTSDLGPVELTLRLGGRYFYTLLSGALQPQKDPLRWSVGLGIGGHLPIGDRFFVMGDLSTHLLGDGSELALGTLLTRFRVGMGWRLLPHLAIVAGATANTLFELDGPRFDALGYGAQLEVHADAETRISFWPGFFIGLEI